MEINHGNEPKSEIKVQSFSFTYILDLDIYFINLRIELKVVQKEILFYKTKKVEANVARAEIEKTK